MPISTCIDLPTLRAYRATEYRVLGSMPCTLRIDMQCPALRALHAHFGVSCSGFLTACNPCSRRCDEAINAARQESLFRLLDTSGRTVLPGVGIDPAGDWPGEDSFLVPGLELPQAQELGRQFEQNAIVWADADCVPRLILLR